MESGADAWLHDAVAMQYSDFTTRLAFLLEIDPGTDQDWSNFLAAAIEHAENRCYRDLDPIVCRKSASLATLSSTIGLPSDCVIARDLSIAIATTGLSTTAPGNGGIWVDGDGLVVAPGLFSPANLPTAAPANGGFWLDGGWLMFTPGPGAQSSLPSATAVSAPAYAGPRLARRDDTFLLELYPPGSPTGTPKYWALTDEETILLGPAPSAAVALSLLYTYRPTALSGSNTTTWLASTYGDLMLYAAMVFGAGYQRDFGAQADNPQAAVSWNQLYEAELTKAKIEESRRKADGYYDRSPAPPPSSARPTGGDNLP